jgi:hypothetical protein
VESLPYSSLHLVFPPSSLERGACLFSLLSPPAAFPAQGHASLHHNRGRWKRKRLPTGTQLRGASPCGRRLTTLSSFLATPTRNHRPLNPPHPSNPSLRFTYTSLIHCLHLAFHSPTPRISLTYTLPFIHRHITCVTDTSLVFTSTSLVPSPWSRSLSITRPLSPPPSLSLFSSTDNHHKQHHNRTIAHKERQQPQATLQQTKNDSNHNKAIRTKNTTRPPSLPFSLPPDPQRQATPQRHHSRPTTTTTTTTTTTKQPTRRNTTRPPTRPRCRTRPPAP